MTDATKTRPRARAHKERSEAAIRNVTLLVLIVVFCATVQIVNDNFLTLPSLRVVGLNISFVGIAAIGAALLMVAGQIDLSIGSIFALSAVVSALLAQSIPPVLAIAAGIASGGLVGLINGLIVWRINVSPIIVTLGALTFVRGLVLILTGDRSVTGVGDGFTILGRSTIFGLPLPILIFVLVALAATFLLAQTRSGLHIRAFGDDRQAAEFAGLNGRRITLGLFATSGLMAGLAGVLAASRLGGASPNFGIGFELEVITAVVLGGVAITGGEGRMTGVVLSVILLGLVTSGITAMGLDPNIGRLVVGGALIAAVAVNQIGQERHQSRQRRQAMEEFAAEGGAAERMGLTVTGQSTPSGEAKGGT
ncbi:ABC transporter permease [Roseisalinus antarcticus]|uniref:D-allose transport system permease protein AlsC n=1 Tax=Roseisalinus antarcticus TaxID=254357 RepID=A0A1Y5RR31_9RHOB|nr:ABC transporter permease [Roseisalinus antarcticus]SLN23295.1 D-allose transport system permease protein AlsC [Roseisalinus antarcticus]